MMIMTMIMTTTIALGAAACGHSQRRESVPTIRPGLAIAMYARPDATGFAVVDDRRFIDVVAGRSLELQLELDDVDPTAPLASLMIESPDLQIGSCTRDRASLSLPPAPSAVPDPNTQLQRRPSAGDPQGTETPDPKLADAGTRVDHVDQASAIVRCQVAGAPGRRLVRMLYVSSALVFRAAHDLATTGDRATLTTRFSIPTKARKRGADWAHAEVTIYDGAPGGQRAPTAVARDQIVLDGSVAVIATPPRDVTAHIRRIFEGALAESPDTPAQDANWGHGSTAEVWVWLELPNLVVTPGQFHVHVAPANEPARDLDVTHEARKDVADALRIPLWIDPDLHGLRERTTIPSTGTLLEDRYVLSVFNRGTVARDVWIEEPMRPARRRAVIRAWPGRPSRAGDVLRSKVKVAPDGRERVSYTIVYDL